MASKDPLDILTTYVRGVKTADTKLLRSLFADDMELVSMNVGCMKGGARIAKYYGQLLAERGGADPTPGPFIRTGNMIAFEIDVRHGDEMHKVSDFFSVSRCIRDRSAKSASRCAISPARSRASAPSGGRRNWSSVKAPRSARLGVWSTLLGCRRRREDTVPHHHRATDRYCRCPTPASRHIASSRRIR